MPAQRASGLRTCRTAGFSLIELLIVIVVMLVIAAIAIPSILRARMAANEASAVASLRSITTAQAAYISTYQGYAPSLAALGPAPGGGSPGPANADLIDSVLASGIKNGYSFVHNALDADGNGRFESYTVNANPVSFGQTGEKYFFVDQTNVLRYADNGPAGPNSSPVPR